MPRPCSVLNMQKRVFIVCEPTHSIAGERISSVDLTPAVSWGEPIILLQSNQSLLNSDSTVKILNEKLADFNDNDYLVPIGDPVLMCAVSIIAAKNNGGRVNFLKWDRRQKKYFSILVRS